MAGPAPSWSGDRAKPQGSFNGLVAVGALYEISIPTMVTVKVSWRNLTRSLQLRAEGDLYFGLSKAGVEGTQRLPFSDTAPYSETLQTNAIWLRNETGGTLKAWVGAVLSDADTTGTDVAFTAALGFDGVSTSVAVDNPAP